MTKIIYADYPTYKNAIIICFKQPFEVLDDHTYIDTSEDANEAREIMLKNMACIAIDIKQNGCTSESTLANIDIISSISQNKKASKVASNVGKSIAKYLMESYHQYRGYRSLSDISDGQFAYIDGIVRECTKIAMHIDRHQTIHHFTFNGLPC